MERCQMLRRCLVSGGSNMPTMRAGGEPTSNSMGEDMGTGSKPCRLLVSFKEFELMGTRS